MLIESSTAEQHHPPHRDRTWLASLIRRFPRTKQNSEGHEQATVPRRLTVELVAKRDLSPNPGQANAEGVAVPNRFRWHSGFLSRRILGCMGERKMFRYRYFSEVERDNS
jgi:hypothetical protein